MGGHAQTHLQEPLKGTVPHRGEEKSQSRKVTFFFISLYERHGLLRETLVSMRPLALTFSNNSWSFLSMLITAFLKDQGRASCHPVCTGAGQGSLTQHSAISTENSIINLNIIATIFKRTNMKG